MTPNYKEQFKIKVRESSISQAKHLVIKSLLVLLIKIKHKNKVIVETERNLGKGIICDVFQKLPKQKPIAYEVQKEVTKNWQKETLEKYSNIDVDLVLIKLKDFSNDYIEIIKKLGDLVI